MQYNKVGDGSDEVLVVFDPAYSRPQSIHNSHPNYNAVLEALEAGETPDESEFDPAEAARERFEAIGDRVSVSGGQVYLDGDPIDNSCTKAILRFLEDGEGDWLPLVEFFEKVQGNPSENSREQLYSFLAANDYGITRDGMLVGYKAVREVEEGVFESLRGGNPGDVQVDGVDAAAKPLQQVGDVVSMQRSLVNPDQFTHCSVGLHVAAFPFAAAGGGMGTSGCPILRVLVSPTDVVSVPNDHNAQKMRVSKYTIDAVVDSPDERALFVSLGEINADGTFAEDDHRGWEDASPEGGRRW